ncbi:MAG: type IV secretory system conjugative DNA transfer family protein [bacterium]
MKDYAPVYFSLLPVLAGGILLETLFFAPQGASLMNPASWSYPEVKHTLLPYFCLLGVAILMQLHRVSRIFFLHYVLPLAGLYLVLLYIVWAHPDTRGYALTAPFLVSADFCRRFLERPVGALILFAPFLWHFFAAHKFKWKEVRARYGYAKFATMRDIRAMGFAFDGPGIVLGRKDGKLITSDQPLSVLCLAPPGTGKTSGFVVPNLLHNQNSMLVYDKKGELYRLTAEARKKMGHAIVLWDITSAASTSFNIFSREFLPESEDDYIPYVDNIGHLLIPSEHAENEFFYRAAQNVFKFFALYALHAEDEVNLDRIGELIFDGGDTAANMKKILEDETIPRSIHRIGEKMLADTKASDQWSGIVGTIRNVFNVFDDANLVRITRGASGFSGAMLRKRPITVYVRVLEKDSERLKPVVKLLFHAVSLHLISAPPSSNDRQVTFICDEFKRMGRFQEMIDLPEISRGYKLNLLIVAQDYGQIETVYGKAAISTLETNTEYKVILRQNNYETAKRISEAIGAFTDKRTSENIDKKSIVDKTVGANQTEEAMALVTAQDIMTLAPGECIIIKGGASARPIKAELAFMIDKKQYEQKLSGGEA